MCDIKQLLVFFGKNYNANKSTICISKFKIMSIATCLYAFTESHLHIHFYYQKYWIWFYYFPNFVGQCKVCGVTEVIIGQWLYIEKPKYCQHMQTSTHIIDDLLKREMWGKLAKRRYKN